MAVQRLTHGMTKLPSGSIAFWIAAGIAAALSLAAALSAFRGADDSATPTSRLSLEEEVRARNDRIAFFEARAANDPLDYSSLNTLAGQYLQRARETGDVADYQRAEIAAARSLEIVPGDNFGGITGLALVRLTQHDFTAAADLAERSISLKPSDPAGYGLLGDALLNLGRYEEAGEAYSRMLELQPGLPALSRMADLAWLRGDVINAEDFWRQALRFDDNLPIENRAWATTQLGGLYFALGNFDMAEKQYDEALKLYPDYLHAMAGLAAVNAAAGQWQDAAGLYRRAATQLPVPQYVAALGDVYARAGLAGEADEQYALVEVIDRLYRANGINNDLQLALFYADHDRQLDEALAIAQSAYDAAPSVYAADALAWTLYKNGRFEEAQSRSTEALRLRTPYAAMHFHAAHIALALGRRDEAIAHLRQVMELNPYVSALHAGEAAKLLGQIENGGPR